MGETKVMSYLNKLCKRIKKLKEKLEILNQVMCL